MNEEIKQVCKNIESEIKYYKKLNISKFNQDIQLKHAMSDGVCMTNKKTAEYIVKLYKYCMIGDLEKATNYKEKIIENMQKKIDSLQKKMNRQQKNNNTKIKFSLKGGYMRNF